MTPAPTDPQLVCGYTPADFFEEPLRVESDGFRLDIAAGRAVATIAAATYAQDPDGSRKRFRSAVERVFRGGQLTQNRPYSVHLPLVERVDASGARVIENFAEFNASVSMRADLTMTITDESGKRIVVDTRQERIDRQARLAKLIAKYQSDATVQSIAASYTAAVRDPADALVHLYEISDALKKHFGGKQAAINKLAIDPDDWSDLGRLSSHEPLRQGRHRGQSAGSLRDATPDELTRARDIAQRMIEKYLGYLEAQTL